MFLTLLLGNNTVSLPLVLFGRAHSFIALILITSIYYILMSHHIAVYLKKKRFALIHIVVISSNSE